MRIFSFRVSLQKKEHLPIKERKDLEIIPETIVAEINFNRKKVFFVLSYCHPNLSSSEYNLYTKSLENIYESIVKEKPSITIFAGDFNARSPIFWENDSENQEGRIFSNFLISNNLEELINEPTHIRNDGSHALILFVLINLTFFQRLESYPVLILTQNTISFMDLLVFSHLVPFHIKGRSGILDLQRPT